MFFRYIYYLSIVVLGAILLLLVFTVTPVGAKVQSFVVQTGSMEPAISPGDLIVVRSQENYKKGDVVTFRTQTREDSIPVTHRIYDIREPEAGNIEFFTRGDANESPDMEPISKDDVLGKVIFSVPFVGRIIDFAKTPMGFVAIFVLPIATMIFAEVRSMIKEFKRLKGSN